MENVHNSEEIGKLHSEIHELQQYISSLDNAHKENYPDERIWNALKQIFLQFASHDISTLGSSSLNGPPSDSMPQNGRVNEFLDQIGSMNIDNSQLLMDPLIVFIIVNIVDLVLEIKG